MRKKIFNGALISAIVAAIACLCANSWAKRERARRLNAHATEEMADRKKNAADAQLSTITAKLRLLEGTSRSERFEAASTPAVSLKRPDSWFKKSARDPALQNLKFAADRDQLRSRYQPFLDLLHLPSEKVDTFLDLTAQHDQQQSDIYASAETEGISMNDPSVLKLLKQAESEYATSLRGLVGDTNYADFQTYQRTVDVRDYVGGISAIAAMAGMPYTRAQAEQLVAVLANASPAYANGQDAARPYNIDWTQADLAVRAVLSPTQYDAYLHLEPSNETGRELTLLNQTIRHALASDKNDPSASSPQ